MISVAACYALIFSCAVVGLIYAFINYARVKKVSLKQHTDFEMTSLHSKAKDEDIALDRQKILLMLEIGESISNGANTFLHQEYKYISIYCLVFSVVVWFASDNFGLPFTTIAFVTGGVTSLVSGYIGMRIAVISNYRTTYEARRDLAPAFKVAYRAGCVMGFALSSLALLVLIGLIGLYRYFTDLSVSQIYTAEMYEQIAGYGLGGSTIALFSRVGGGIFTKAADVGADLVGKLEHELPEDSPKNPATIADNVGDNVGDIAGMGADLFGSFAESSSAALVVLAEDGAFRAAVAKILPPEYQDTYLFFPIVISAIGIICCLICSLAATDLMEVHLPEKIENTLKWQLILSTVLLTGGIYLSCAITVDFDASFTVGTKLNGLYDLTAFNAWVCAVSGLIAGFIIGYVTEYYTSKAYTPVKEVAQSCTTGAATNIIYGLALGYHSTIVPIFALAIASFISHTMLGLLGVALAALGMLSNLAISLAIDAYGPISDNAGGIAEMAHLGELVRQRTDALDAAGNTTAAIGKGFAIGSAALVSLALYGAFITRAGTNPLNDPQVLTIKKQDVYVADAMVFSGLLIGAMLPYAFSALTMKSVGRAAFEMVIEVRRQLRENPGIKTGESSPDYDRCIAISTKSALKEMIAPGALVVGAPILTGFVFGPKAVAGILPGILLSGVQMAISSSNAGGAWDNAKKYIEAEQLTVDGVTMKKGSKPHKAAVVGDTVGDPLKDTSGPSLNILIKLSAILSLVFAAFFQRSGYLVCLVDAERHSIPRCNANLQH